MFENSRNFVQSIDGLIKKLPIVAGLGQGDSPVFVFSFARGRLHSKVKT